MTEITKILMLAIFGLILGSFINAWVWRLHEQLDDDGNPKKLSKKKAEAVSISKGRSMCPHCKHQLATKDLVPVFSWLWLKGKCRYCAKPISTQYPLVELGVGLLFVLSYIFWPYNIADSGWILLVGWLFTLVPLVAMAIYDAKWYILPSRLIYIATGFYLSGLVAYTAVSGRPTIFVNSVVSGVVFFGLLGSVYLVSAVAQRKGWSSVDWLGFGDVRLSVLLGLVAGSVLNVFIALFMASVFGIIAALPSMLQKKRGMASQIPFGPFLIAGAAFALFFGNGIIGWYTTVMLGM